MVVAGDTGCGKSTQVCRTAIYPMLCAVSNVIGHLLCAVSSVASHCVLCLVLIVIHCVLCLVLSFTEGDYKDLIFCDVPLPT